MQLAIAHLENQRDRRAFSQPAQPGAMRAMARKASLYHLQQWYGHCELQ
ncbi:hypothetical protein GCM10007052_25820 [Halioglobus japonicus]|nr:hypothetical protein GCM10007052_25820 [Halioglobus japonicus]